MLSRGLFVHRLERQDRHRRFQAAFIAWALGIVALSSGCAGQLQGAMVEHARSTRSVAATIKKALESVKCDAAAASCPTAVSVIEDQVKALNDGANKLESSGH